MCWPRWLSSGLLGLGLLTALQSAHAQPATAPNPVYLVLPVTKSDEHLEVLGQAAADVDRALLSDQLERLPLDAAVQAFAERHSALAADIAPQEVEALRRDGRFVASAAAQFRLPEALDLGREVQARFADRLETLNRLPDGAKLYFSACAATVRALLMSQNIAEARTTAHACRDAVPDLKPDETQNPPPVVKLFEQIDLEDGEASGILDVETDPRRCDVYAQGRYRGRAPIQIRARLGARYKIQVACDGRPLSRVYTITFRQRPQSLLIDAHLEEAVQTDRTLLRLRYEHVDDFIARAHALQLANALSIPGTVTVSDLILVSRPQNAQTLLRLVNNTAGRSVTLAEPHTPSDVRRALAQLLERDAPDTAAADLAAEPATGADGIAVDRRTARRRRAGKGRWRLPTGALLVVGAGTAAGLAGGRFHAYRQAGATFKTAIPGSYEEYSDDHAAWRHHRRAPYALAATSSVLLTAGGITLYDLVPAKHRAWLAPALAAAGVGLLAGGAVHIAKGASCDVVEREAVGPCVQQQEQRDKGGVLALSAFPWLAVSAYAFTRYLLGPSPVEVSVSLLPRHSEARLSFRF